MQLAAWPLRRLFFSFVALFLQFAYFVSTGRVVAFSFIIRKID
jgi:hypothetical protein